MVFLSVQLATDKTFDGIESLMRMVYEDGTKIDYAIWPVEPHEKRTQW
jgi:hypothetical protein